MPTTRQIIRYGRIALAGYVRCTLIRMRTRSENAEQILIIPSVEPERDSICYNSSIVKVIQGVGYIFNDEFNPKFSI